MSSLLIAVLLVLLFFYGARYFDPEVEVYEDTWTSRASFPDKLVHFLGGVVLTMIGLSPMVGLPLLHAVLLTAWLAIVYEIGQHFPNNMNRLWAQGWRDVLATVLGGLAAVLTHI